MDGEEADNSKDTTDSKTKKIKGENKMEKKEAKTTDLTAQQNEENYWHTTVETKLDGSTLMMETRISKLMEATGMSREKASKEVKKRMKKAGSENTNTEDMTEDAHKADKEVYDAEEKEEKEEEKEEKTEDKETEKKDTLEVPKERIDFLEAFFNEHKEEEKTQAARLDVLEETIKKYQEQEAEKLNTELDERILKFATDFLVPEEEVIKKLEGRKGKDGLKYVQDLEDIINLSSKKPEDNKSDGTFDATDFLAQAEAQAQKVRADLRHI